MRRVDLGAESSVEPFVEACRLALTAVRECLAGGRPVPLCPYAQVDEAGARATESLAELLPGELGGHVEQGRRVPGLLQERREVAAPVGEGAGEARGDIRTNEQDVHNHRPRRHARASRRPDPRRGYRRPAPARSLADRPRRPPPAPARPDALRAPDVPLGARGDSAPAVRPMRAWQWGRQSASPTHSGSSQSVSPSWSSSTAPLQSSGWAVAQAGASRQSSSPQSTRPSRSLSTPSEQSSVPCGVQVTRREKALPRLPGPSTTRL